LSRLGDAPRASTRCRSGRARSPEAGLPLDRAAVASELGFASLTANSLDAVSDRDYCLEITADLSILMTHLSRFCEEIVLWSTEEFGFIDLSERWSTGSSIMPQKKNPDFAELIRGRAGKVYGDLRRPPNHDEGLAALDTTATSRATRKASRRLRHRPFLRAGLHDDDRERSLAD
jgi:argininosuccinate lyase